MDYMNEKKVNIPFTFENAAYHDNEYEMDIILQGGGKFQIAAGNADLSEEEKAKLSETFSLVLKKTFAAMSDMSIGYSELAYKTDAITDRMRPFLDSFFGGVLKGFHFSSICPDEKSVLAMMRMKQAKAAAVRSEQTAQPQPVAQSAQASKVEVVLQNCGPNKVKVVSILRDAFRIGLKDAKDMAEKTPYIILRANSEEEMTNVQRAFIGALQNAGAVVDMRVR